ncbi:MAG TPA: hypothetical protein PKE31_21105 [Pseudomonadota bacterium]|jgi:hypothetical protein|nr:hypothetical protein [Pseudomonadota bacterium]
MAVNPEHVGSKLDDLLDADGTLAEVTSIAEARVRAYLATQPSDDESVRVPPSFPKVAVAR